MAKEQKAAETPPTLNPSKVAAALREAQELADKLREEYPEIAADEQLWADMMEGSTGASDLAAWFVRRSMDFAQLEEAAKERAASITNRRKRFEAAKDSMRRTAALLVIGMGQKNLKREDFTLSITEGQQVLVINDPTKIPDTLRKPQEPAPPRMPDHLAIRAYLETGGEIEGVSLEEGKTITTVRWKN